MYKIQALDEVADITAIILSQLGLNHQVLCKETPGFSHGEELLPRCMGGGEG